MPGLIADPQNLYCDPPLNENGERLTGQMNYHRKDKFTYVPDEKQVNGSLARYNVPMYKELHYLVRKEVEKRLLEAGFSKIHHSERFQGLYAHK